MSIGCTKINETEYAIYDASYNPINNKCVKSDGTWAGNDNNGSTGCSDEDFACYASYRLNQLRQNVDPKMAELYSGKGSVQHMNNANYDATMLSGVIWAMLGTTVLYYAFTKM